MQLCRPSSGACAFGALVRYVAPAMPATILSPSMLKAADTLAPVAVGNRFGALAVALVVAWKSKNLMGTIIAGMVSL